MVRYVSAATLAMAGAISATAGAQQRARTVTPLVFDSVTVIDVEQGKLIPDQRVVIVGSRVRSMGAVGTVKLPRGGKVVAARGKYLIPGLWDMHVHVAPINRDSVSTVVAAYHTYFPLFLAYGVTGVREMAQRFPHNVDSTRVWQREIAAGARLGPRTVGPVFNIFATGSLEDSTATLEGPSGTIQLRTAADVRRLVDSLKTAGIAYLKFNEHLKSNGGGTGNLYFTLLREARRIGLPFVGHVPGLGEWGPVSSIEAADSGQRSIEHVTSLTPCWGWGWPADSTRAEDWDSVRVVTRCTPVAAAYIRNGTWVTPTFAVEKSLQAIPNSIGQNIDHAQMVVQTLHRLGVTRFLAGSDFYYRGRGVTMLAGSSLLEELVLLTELGGLTPLEALQAATLNPAKFLDATDSLGTVAPGKLADLVLLDKNPLADIRNTQQIRAVVANGRYFDRAALDRLLAEFQANAKPGP